MKKYQNGGWYRGGKISKSGKKALGITGATSIGGMIGTAIDRGVKKNKAVKSIMKKDDVSRKKARQKYNKTNDAAVLGYFNDIKEAKYGAMMNNYNAPLAMMSEGGSCGPGKKRKCKKKFGKRGGKLKKVLRGAGTAALGIGAGIAGSKALKAFKNNGGF